jgi:anti-sigma-K factor RskA
MRLAAWRGRLALAAAALLALGLGIWNLSLNQALTGQQQLVRLVAQGDARELSTTTASGDVHGRAFVEPSTNQVLVAVSRLPELAANRTYQIWFTSPEGGPVSGGTFRVGDGGTAAVLASAPGGLHGYVGVGVSNEPLGGSAAPSTPMLMYWAL